MQADDLDAFDDSSHQIGNRQFRRLIGSENYKELESACGYARHLRLAADWHVTYARGLWRGKPAVCCFWSSYHHIFVLGTGAA